MRTRDPNNIKSDYLDGLQDIENAFASMAGAALNEAHKNLLAEYSFLGASVLMEGFVSDLFVAYVNRDNSAFVGYLTQKMEIDTSDAYAKRAKDIASIDIKSHLTQETIREILDPHGYNVAFRDSGHLKERAGLWLTSVYKSRMHTLTSGNCAVFDTVKAVRNFLAHRSAAAKNTMQDSLVNPDLPSVLQRGSKHVHKVGYYLDSRPRPGGPHRLESYLTECRSLANVLCP